MATLRQKSTLSSLHRLRKSTCDLSKNVRVARSSDIEQIKTLVTMQTRMLFGDVNVDDIIWKTYITLVLERDKTSLAACLCVNNYPNVPSIPPWSWTSWLHNLYQMTGCTARNTLWVHLAAFDFNHTYIFLKPLLTALFKKCKYLQFVFFVVPPKVKYTDWLEAYATQIMPKGYSDPTSVQTLYVTMRQHFTLSYKIRRAVVEDNDDIVPLIDSHAERLRDIYGDFYVAELITMHKDSGRSLIVAEYGGYAVAVMCLNNNVNYNVMNEAFKLEVFYGLKKYDKRDTFKIADADLINYKETVAGVSRLHYDTTVPEESSSEEERSQSAEESIDYISEDDYFSTISSDVYMLDIEGFGEPVKLEEEEEEEEEEEDSDLEERGSSNFLGHVQSLVSCLLLAFDEQDLDRWKNKTGMPTAEPSQAAFKTKQLPVYHGEDNAFVLEIAAAQPEHEEALKLLLEAAFEVFPEKDYCVVCVPSTVLTFPLLATVFVKAIPRPSSTFQQELYVLHRSAVAGDLKVRPATQMDSTKVEKLLSPNKKNLAVIAQFNASVRLEGCPLRSYVMVCDDQLIGIAILNDQEDVAYLHSHYQVALWTDLTRHRAGCHGSIDHFILSPIFQHHIRFFLLELHRFSDYSILYYKIHPNDVKWSTNRVLTSVLGELLPVVPSKIPEYPQSESEDWVIPEVIERVEPPYALYLTTTMHCGLSRYGVNHRIVVVGASDVGLSFLVSLLLKNNPSYRVTYYNVTMVSPHGICRYKNDIREYLLPTTSEIHGHFLSLISLRTYVNVVHGVMSSIDRKNKTITVNNTQLSYDVLFLMCGHQYPMPERSEELRRGKFEYPENCFVINTEVDAESALNKLKQLLAEHVHGSIIVYGYNLEAFCCLAGMLEYGIAAPNLIYVEPPEDDNDLYQHRRVFNDPDIEESILGYIRQEGVKIYSGYKFIDWSFDKYNVRIETIKFESKHKIIDLDCMALFYYGEKGISPRTYAAINTAGLIYDGALVINPNCQTNDPNIYAAGTMTKYPRRYYADHMAHKYFNRVEIGHKLAEQIGGTLLPQIHVKDKETMASRCHDENKMLVPRYVKPLVVYAHLPGKLNYMYVHKPGKQAPLEVAMAADDYGQVLTSGDPRNVDDQGYFRLHLNQYNTVETITCLAKFEIEKVNLTHLWGKHERVLNNLVKRFEMVLIEDLFAYFRQPWSFALYHDRFTQLNEDMSEILTSLTDIEGGSVIEDILSILKENHWKSLGKKQIMDVMDKFMGSEYHKILEEKFLAFLTENLLYLPVYAHPVVIAMILGAYEESPLFKDM